MPRSSYVPPAFLFGLRFPVFFLPFLLRPGIFWGFVPPPAPYPLLSIASFFLLLCVGGLPRSQPFLSNLCFCRCLPFLACLVFLCPLFNLVRSSFFLSSLFRFLGTDRLGQVMFMKSLNEPLADLRLLKRRRNVKIIDPNAEGGAPEGMLVQATLLEAPAGEAGEDADPRALPEGLSALEYPSEETWAR